MKKNIILPLLLISFIYISAEWVEIAEQAELFNDISTTEEIIIDFGLDGYETENIRAAGTQYTHISYPNAGEYALEGMPNLPLFSTLIAIPNEGNVHLEIISEQHQIVEDIMVYPRQALQSESQPPRNDFIKADEYYSFGAMYPKNSVSLGEPAILRDYRVVRLTINPFQFDPLSRQMTINTAIQVKITTDREDGVNELHRRQLPSKAFSNIYEGTIINFESISREEEYQQPSCLYIYTNQAQVIDYLNYILDWRRQQGYKVTAVSTAVTGNSTNGIKDYIQDAYDEWENPPEYVCLVGDANGSFYIPCYWVDQGETDNNFVQLAGNDVLPDAAIGRLPIGSLSDLGTTVSKVLYYETEPYTANEDWFERGLMVGDPSTSGSSCVDSKVFVTNMMSQHAPAVDAIEVYSGNFSTQMNSNLNQGCVYFNYRGFGDLSGWSNNAIDELSNGSMLSCMVFLTCGTGSYGGSQDALSEHFIKAGTATSPKGGVAAIATATNSTHTTFNNVMDIGIWSGIFVDETWSMGMGLIRGKLAIYTNFPGNPSNHQHQFIAWHNLMGDPAMEMWSASPQQFIVEYPDAINIAEDKILVQVFNQNSAAVSNAKVILLDEDNNNYVAFTDNDGIAWLNVDELETGDINLTVIKHDFIPGRYEVELNQSEAFLEMGYEINDLNGNGDGLINPGEQILMDITLTNHYAETISGLTLTAISPVEGLLFTIDEISFNNIVAGDSQNGIIEMTIPMNMTGIEQVTLYLTAENSTDDWQLEILEPVNAPYLEIDDFEINITDDFDPGDDAEVVVYIENLGLTTASDVNIELSCLDSRIEITENTASLGEISVGSIADNDSEPFHISAGTDIIPGSQIIMRLNVTTPETQHPALYFTITVGDSDIGDPLGPDAHGYYCYDETDVNYIECPQYNWIEIDPDYGGNGTILPLMDSGNTGDVTTIDLPIMFNFYGVNYSELSVCSNGWISPGGTNATDFMNYSVPGVGGPSPMIAPYWDDIKIGTGNICYYYNQVEHTLILEWSRVKNDWDDSIQTFQAILYDASYYPTSSGDSSIKFQYDEFSNPNQGSYGGFYVYHGQFVTVGLEDHTSTQGLEYTYNNQYPRQAAILHDEAALFFTGAPISSNEAYLVLSDQQVLDSTLDGRIDYGDDVELLLSLGNLGTQSAAEVSTTTFLNDPYVTLLNNTITYPDIPAGEAIYPENGFLLQVSELCPDNYSFSLTVNVCYNGITTEQYRSINCYAPVISGNGYFVFNDDNDDKIIDPGETFDLGIIIANTGSAPVYLPQGTLVSVSGDLTINGELNQLLRLEPEASSYYIFNATVSDDLEPGDNLMAMLEISGDMGINAGFIYQINVGITMEGFETGDFSLLPWETGGDEECVISDVSHSGFFAAQSGDIDNSQSTWIQLDISSSLAGELSFWMDVDTKSGWDFVHFLIDDVIMDFWSGDTGWFESDYTLSEGNHTLLWYYEKEYWLSTPPDCFWLDDITLPYGGGNPPQVLLTDTASLDYSLSAQQTAGSEINILNVSSEIAEYALRVDGNETNWFLAFPAEGFIAPGDVAANSIVCIPQGLPTGQYTAEIVISDNFGNNLVIPVNLTYSEVAGNDTNLPAITSYSGNYPNPFNPQTTFAFQLSDQQKVNLMIYNIKGQKVCTLVNGQMDAGYHNIIWNGKDDQQKNLASGIYFARFSCGEFNKSSKLLLLK